MKLLEQVRQALRVKHYAYRTEQCYLRWIEQYIRFHKTDEGFRHPALLGGAEVEAFLTRLAVGRHVSASTQNQALGALLFLYQHVLDMERGWLDAVRAWRSRRLPVVLVWERGADYILSRGEGGPWPLLSQYSGSATKCLRLSGKSWPGRSQ